VTAAVAARAFRAFREFRRIRIRCLLASSTPYRSD